MRMVIMSTETKIITMIMIITMTIIIITGIIIIIIIPMMMMNNWAVVPVCLPSAGSSRDHPAEVPLTVFAA